MQETKLGTIRIAPSVMAMIVSLTARHIDGVAGMSVVSRPPNRVMQRTNMGHAPGVILHVRNGTVSTDVYIVAAPETKLKKLGQAVQSKVREALDLMLGMSVDQVNVYIEDVGE